MSKKRKPKEESVSMQDSIKIQPIPAPMANTITLSTDMTTLYLIEGNGRAIPYSLHAIGGVYVGLLGGQLTVVSALEPMPDPGSKPVLAASTRSVTEATATPIQRVKSVRLSTDNAQWSALFIRKNFGFVLIGATDIDSSLTGESDNLNAEGYLFDLREGFINIRKSGDQLIAVLVPMRA